MAHATPERVIRVSAAVIVDTQGKVLVVRKRGTTTFMQPGGKFDADESAPAALRRELAEELDVTVAARDVRPLGRFTAAAANEPGHSVDAELFAVTLDAAPRAAAEIEEIRWVDPAAPGDVDLAPLTVQVVFGLVTGPDEGLRAARLLDAQTKAARLFDEVSERQLVRAGIGERALSDEIRDLANDMFGITRHWHKRIVRSGENTLETARDNPPDRVIGDDDIVFLDFGPLFEQWEADFGRTYVLGDDPRKQALRDDLPRVWDAGRAHFDQHPDITGAQLFDFVVATSRDHGWEFGGVIAGHLVGEFPHEKIDGAEIDSYVAPGSHLPMRRKDRSGRECHWILEVHLVDGDRRFGGFHEELLDLP